jgi:hypothetical protein
LRYGSRGFIRPVKSKTRTRSKSPLRSQEACLDAVVAQSLVPNKTAV